MLVMITDCFVASLLAVGCYRFSVVVWFSTWTAGVGWLLCCGCGVLVWCCVVACLLVCLCFGCLLELLVWF